MFWLLSGALCDTEHCEVGTCDSGPSSCTLTYGGGGGSSLIQHCKLPQGLVSHGLGHINHRMASPTTGLLHICVPGKAPVWLTDKHKFYKLPGLGD